MQTFVWGPDFMTDLVAVDDQHQELVAIINRFAELQMSGDADPAHGTDVLNELLDYTKYHFAEEQASMKQTGLDERHLRPHLTEHARFLSEVSTRVSSFDPTSADDAETLLSFLVNWLICHILGTDQNMARQTRAIEAGATPAEAFDVGEANLDSATSTLLASMRALSSELTTRNRELTELNQSLETRVRERTQELEALNERLEMMALTDALTGLSNRRATMLHLERLWDISDLTGEPLSCLMIDADKFKQINDTCGHDAGDEVLRQLAQTLGEAVRNDDIVSRLGGDEFFVACPNADADGVALVAAKVLAAVNALVVEVEGGAWHGQVSIGAATRTTEMDSPDALLKAADVALYAAKEAGRNCIRSA